MATASEIGTAAQRVLIQGIVQGVGFRPYLHRLARELGLRGRVRNFTGGVEIEVEGPGEQVARFVERLPREAPPIAQIESLQAEELAPRGYPDFVIVSSREEKSRAIFVSPEVALCEDCRRELLDPADRRFRHPFINCTNCGPRFTLVRKVPYDRPHTSMAEFPMCEECAREYAEIEDRRYHAQPVACPRCGPRLSLWEEGQVLEGEEALRRAQELLRAGGIVAVKGLGGFHLACDASSEEAVRRLRERKGREDKPLAVMVGSLEVAEELAELEEESRELLAGPRAPIVLARKRRAEGLAEGVAPGSSDWGLLLPYTPLHVLLFEGLGRRALVMTSGNLSEEPLCTDNAQAHRRLGRVADAFLEHDREIVVGCDDSVVRASRRGAILMRRSRGYAPLPVALAEELPRALGVGGHYKNTFCLTSGRYAFLSQHIGDLAEADNVAYFERCVEHLEEVWQARPELLACDLHPDYLSTRYARLRAMQEGLPLQAVQHHHAHLVSCLADQGLEGPAVGIVCDGTGCGEDGAVWGGEVLVGGAEGYERAGHLGYVPLPGGERAIREPWRMGAVYLREGWGAEFAEELAGLEFCRRLNRQAWEVLEQMLAQGINCPRASSAGRLFDAVAALLGLGEESRYEGQAAQAVESVAGGRLAPGGEEGYRGEVREEEGGLVADPRPLIRGVVEDLLRGEERGRIARRFHEGFAQMMVEMAARVAQERGVELVALSGGTFQNRILLERCAELVEQRGLRAVWHRRVPPNDGGLALGQAVVAARAR